MLSEGRGGSREGVDGAGVGGGREGFVEKRRKRRTATTTRRMC